MRATLLTTTLLSTFAQLPAAPAAGQAPPDAPEVALCPGRRGWASLPRAELAAARRGRLANLVVAGADGGLAWNGAPVDLDILGRYLDLTVTMMPHPVLVLSRAAGASCDAVAVAAARAERHVACTPDLCLLTAGEQVRGVAPPAPPAPPLPR